MKFELSVRSGNAAFDGDPRTEISRILSETATRIDGGAFDGVIFDANGNSVGLFCLDVPEPDDEDEDEETDR